MLKVIEINNIGLATQNCILTDWRNIVRNGIK